MDFLFNLGGGLATALQPINLLYGFLGTFLGTVIGVLPGIGPLATIAMLLPLTFGLQPETSLIMLAGIYYGSQYGGSTTAILVNLPGESSSAVTTLDGYQMARRGRAGQALAAAALASFLAGTLATLMIAVVAQPVAAIATSFGPAEYFALLTLGLVSSIALASGSVIKAVGTICLGMLLGLTGTDLYTGTARFTFGQLDLLDGLDFVPLAVGLFGISEILRNLEGGNGGQTTVTKVTRLWPSRSDLARIVGPSLRGTAIGSFLGVLPGGGALLSSLLAYNFEKRVSKNHAEFGKGAIEGVAAPEAANNAGAQASFIPMLSLGVPSNVVMALMIGAMMVHGIAPGPKFITDHASTFWGLVASMWVGNAMLVILNLPLIGLWVRLLQIPYSILFPAIVVLSGIGVYSIDNSSFNVLLIILAGFVGYLLLKFECELAPFILGFVLGPMLEEHLRRAMMLYEGDATVFVTRPISAALLLVAAVLLGLASMPALARKREEVFAEEA